jgi:hypothetical protein
MVRPEHLARWRVIDLAMATQAALDLAVREGPLGLALLARRFTVIEGSRGDGAAPDPSQPPRENTSYG